METTHPTTGTTTPTPTPMATATMQPPAETADAPEPMSVNDGDSAVTPTGDSVTPSPRAGPDGPAPCSCTHRNAERLTRLAAAATEAAQVRSLTTRPDVVALRVDRIRAQVDALLWAGIGLGLGFTTVNVQAFAAAGAAAFTTGWWVAWLLDPMVSLVLLAVLRAEQVTARYEVALGSWPRCTKWCAFAATYLMNTWHSWGLDGTAPSVSGIVLHSVPPLLVLLSAETGPVLRERLTEAARRASTDHGPRHDAGHDNNIGTNASDHDEHSEHESPPDTGRGVHEELANTPSPAYGDVRDVVHDVGSRTVHEPGDHRDATVRERATRERRGSRPRSEPAARRRTSAQRPGRTTVPRRLLADYLADAREALNRAAADGHRPDPTPAWCRRTTGCSQGTSIKLAAALRASPEADATAASAASEAITPARHPTRT